MRSLAILASCGQLRKADPFPITATAARQFRKGNVRNRLSHGRPRPPVAKDRRETADPRSFPAKAAKPAAAPQLHIFRATPVENIARANWPKITPPYSGSLSLQR